MVLAKNPLKFKLERENFYNSRVPELGITRNSLYEDFGVFIV